jgi:hypothetical protein
MGDKRRMGTYEVSPAAFTAGNGTHPFNTSSQGLYLRYKLPVRPEGTVWGKPTTASWLMTARGRRERGLGKAETREAAARSWREIFANILQCEVTQ